MSLIIPKIKLKNSTFFSIFKAFKRFLGNHFFLCFFHFWLPFGNPLNTKALQITNLQDFTRTPAGNRTQISGLGNLRSIR